MAERDRLLARTAADAATGKWEKHEISSEFGGTATHPWWLETASQKKS